MASGGSSLYAVLGVASDCSDAELRTAYRKLAMVRSIVDSHFARLLCRLLFCSLWTLELTT
jgi:hypothetical protein